MKIDVIGLIRKYGPTVVIGVRNFFSSKNKKSKDGGGLIDDLLGGGQKKHPEVNPDDGLGIGDIIKTFVKEQKKVSRSSRTTKSKTKKKNR